MLYCVVSPSPSIALSACRQWAKGAAGEVVQPAESYRVLNEIVVLNYSSHALLLQCCLLLMNDNVNVTIANTSEFFRRFAFAL